MLLLCLLQHVQSVASPAPEDYQPFETRDQNIFNLIHGQALPTNAALLDKNNSLLSSGLVVTNALNIESSPDEAIYLDYETYRFTFSYQYGISENWNLKFDIPLVHQSGGVLDSTIDNWHEFFGLPRANRPFVKHNQYDIRYDRNNQSLVDLSEHSTTFGDIQIALSHALIKNNSTVMSLWGSLKLATGDEDKLSGSGATDFSTWLALNQRLTQNWLLNINTGIVLTGENNYKNIPLDDHALYGHIMLGWLASENFSLKLQLQGHTGYYQDSRLKILGNTYFITFGGTIKLNQCQQLDIAVSEDIKVDASPDASFIISWRNYISRC